MLPIDARSREDFQRESNFKLKPFGSSMEQMGTKEDDMAMLLFFETMFGNDIRFKIVFMLSNREAAGLREIAKDVGISHKNLAKYLVTLEQKGIVETFPIGIRDRVYRLARKYNFVRKFL